MRTWSCALPLPPVPSPRVLRVAAEIWRHMDADRRNAGPILSRALREARTLGSKERPIAGDLLAGLVRHERALARIDPDPIRAWLRLAEEGLPDLDDPPNAFAIATSMPDEIAAEWWDRLGSERAVELARRLAGRAPVALRVLREPVDLPVPHERVGPRSIVLGGRTNLHLLEAWKEGRIEVQDLGSQHIVDVAFPGEGATVLDLCAGAGGKALALAAMGARVQAWDVRPDALDELARRAARARLDVRIAPPHGTFDVVLVDAPCSGTGVLRRHPENRWKLRFPTETQRDLLARATRMAGRVVYATCSLVRAENEGVTGVDGETLWPTERAEGFYVATLAAGTRPDPAPAE